VFSSIEAKAMFQSTLFGRVSVVAVEVPIGRARQDTFERFGKDVEGRCLQGQSTIAGTRWGSESDASSIAQTPSANSGNRCCASSRPRRLLPILPASGDQAIGGGEAQDLLELCVAADRLENRLRQVRRAAGRGGHRHGCLQGACVGGLAPIVRTSPVNLRPRPEIVRSSRQCGTVRKRANSMLASVATERSIVADFKAISGGLAGC
jgi:hypothetical protein